MQYTSNHVDPSRGSSHFGRTHFDCLIKDSIIAASRLVQNASLNASASSRSDSLFPSGTIPNQSAVHPLSPINRAITSSFVSLPTTGPQASAFALPNAGCCIIISGRFVGIGLGVGVAVLAKLVELGEIPQG